MKRAILLGDSPFLGEVEGLVQYALERYYSMGINRIINKFKTNAHVFVDPFLLKLTNSRPDLFTLSLRQYGDLVAKENKELIDTYTYHFDFNSEKDLYKDDKLAWCGFTHDYALSYLITKGYDDIVLLGTADFVSGPHYSNPYELKCAQRLKDNSKKFIEHVCSKRALIQTCNPNSYLEIPRIDIRELIKV